MFLRSAHRQWGAYCAIFLLVADLSSGACGAAQPPSPNKEPIDADHAAKMTKGLDLFKKQIRPILEQKCWRCHGGKNVESELDMNERAGLLKGGRGGPAIIPGKGQDSLLVKLISHARDPHMPKGGDKLPPEMIARIVTWIDLGAPYDNPLAVAKARKKSWTDKILPAEDKKFWSFEHLHATAPPEVKNTSWCRTPVDRFLLARLEGAGIVPNPPADKQHLIRRAFFDLVGLPPTPEEVKAFAGDSSADAYARLIDRLLASPHFGERWARHWLDLARFAESHGFEHDTDRPSAYHYRDAVIEALNLDLPYDTFVKWQIAGDEFEPGNNLALKLTGFLAAGVHSTQITKNEVVKQRYDEMDDKLATLGTTFLGLTIGCARCHDHKYDPIPQRDYYRLLSTFTTTIRSEMELNLDPEGYKNAKAHFDREHIPLVKELEAYEHSDLPEQFNAWRQRNGVAAWPATTSAEQTRAVLQWYRTIDPGWRALNQKVQGHLAKAPRPLTAKVLVATEGLPAVRLHTQGEDFLPQTYFLRRGDPDNRESVATQSFLQVLMPSDDSQQRWQETPPPGWRTSYRRRALANWLTDTDKGAGTLLARVIVNRLWQHVMGRGLVATPSNFGLRGEKPTHPELLDYLAGELIRNGWRLKPILRLIMTSAAYQESSHIDDAKLRVDRDNLLLWRHPARRLEAEAIRDTLLSVSGTLDPHLYGPGTLDPASRCRSIYFTVKRSKLMPMMVVFDAPEALTGMAERPTTTIAPQALLLLNNPQVRGWAHDFARRIAPEATTSLEDALQGAYVIALARQPTQQELADGVAFVNQQSSTYSGANPRAQALADFCQVLMCLNEFVYVD
jgi:hypothetical protein